MFFVRALSAGPWRSIDISDQQGNKLGERNLVMALETGCWCVDNRSVAVEPGLCVSFADLNDAGWFLQQSRAQFIGVEIGSVVAFELETDAAFFVHRQLGEPISQREAEDYFARLNGGHDAEGEEEDTAMFEPKIDNKGMKPSPETKKAAPKPAASKGARKAK